MSDYDETYGEGPQEPPREVEPRPAVEYVVIAGWLCESSDRCTCGTGGTGYPGHESGCGVENLVKVDKLLDEHEVFRTVIVRVKALADQYAATAEVHAKARDTIPHTEPNIRPHVRATALAAMSQHHADQLHAALAKVPS